MPNALVAVAGIVSTLTTACVGLYFTSRSRTAPMRDLLYTKQVELAVRMFRAVGRARVFAVLLAPDSEYQAKARDDIRSITKRYSILCDEAAMLFPTELYVAIKGIENVISTLISQYDDGEDIKPSLASLNSQTAKAALMVRVLFGVDELSSESIKLHSKHDQLASIAEMELSVFQPKRDKPSAN
jgi:hypothetical protein